MVLIPLLRLWERGSTYHPGAQLSKLRKYGRAAAEELFENDPSYSGKRLEGETPLLFRSLHRQSRLGSRTHGAVEDLPEPAKEKLDDKVQGKIRATALSGLEFRGTDFQVMPIRIPKIHGPCGNPLVEYGAFYGYPLLLEDFHGLVQCCIGNTEGEVL